LKQLKSIATIQSVGASTRIEGSKLTDYEVGTLLNEIDISKIEDRDSQEVVGYFNVLDSISDSFADIEIKESNIKNLHNLLLKFSIKDHWHKGNYKQHTNSVQATFPDGTKQVIFKTSEAGLPTETAMKSLIEWYGNEKEVHPLISCATFAYDFLSVHPFQDGNGRLSRLLTTLLLLKSGYKWIEYVSFEHEIESNKKTYYQVLRNCQAQRPNEDITNWIDFFLQSLINLQSKLQNKLDSIGLEANLSPKEKEVLTFIGNNAGSKSGEIVKKLNISKPTLKRLLTNLIEKALILKHGKGAGTNYSIK
jgi:Fic family protein